MPDLIWLHNEPGAAAAAPPVASGASPTSWYTTPENVQHIAYVGTDHNIHELFFFIGGDGVWRHNIPGAAAGAPPVASGTSPTSWYTTPENVQHIAYVGTDQKIHELFFAIGGDGVWRHNVPGAAAGARRVASGTCPTSWYTTPENVQHIAYVGTDQRIHELFFVIGGDGVWRHNVPGAAANAPLVASATSPTSWYTKPENVQHIAYVGTDQKIHELFFLIGGDGVWRHNVPGAAGGALPVASGASPTSWYTTPENVQHIAYVGTDQKIHELFFFISGVTRWAVLPKGANSATQLNYAAVLAVHAALLPTNEILYFGGDEHDPNQWQTGNVNHTRLFNCATLQVEQFNPGSPSSDVFCCGHAMLGDGRLLVAGGTEVFVGHDPGLHHDHMPGLRNTWIYDPHTRAWSQVGLMFDPSPLFPHPTNPAGPRGGRWYPTLVTLGDGSIIALSGHPSSHDERHNNHIPERFVPSSNSWTPLSAPIPEFEITNDTRLYPRAHLLPDGTLFCSTPLGLVFKSQLIDPRTGSRRFAGAAPPRDTVDSLLPNGVYWGNSFTQCASSVLLPLSPPDYAPRVLICGGQIAFVIDLRTPDGSPQWVPTNGRTLSGPRYHLNAVLLPTGEVFVSGGCSVFNKDSARINVPELYNPETNSWRALTSQPASVVRNYHSVALLMPDGRIWTAGSNHDGLQGAENAEKRIEIFQPDYVDRTDRPRISGAPDNVMYGQTFDVETPDASSIRRVALIRTGSVTHSFNADQRYIRLDFRRTSKTRLSATAPPNGQIAPPGYYLLYLINAEGLPSGGKFVRM